MALVHRAPMRSRLPSDVVAPWAGIERALSVGTCGVGGRLDRPPSSLDAALVAVDAAWGEPVARRLERFVAVPDGSLVWTRDADGRFHEGTLAGPWAYDADPDAWAADLVHVRRCRWRAPVGPQDAPPAVVASYERGGLNFQRVHGT